MTNNPKTTGLPCVLLVVTLLLCPGSLPASPAASHAKVPGHVPPNLVGTWHTVSIDGDCLFLIIREVRLTLQTDGRFIASVRFRDDSVKSMTGSFQVKPDHMLVFQSPSAGQDGLLRYQVRDKDRKLRVHDEKFSVTVDLTRMQPRSAPK